MENSATIEFRWVAIGSQEPPEIAVPAPAADSHGWTLPAAVYAVDQEKRVILWRFSRQNQMQPQQASAAASWRRDVQYQPIDTQLANRFRELVEINGLPYVAVCAEIITSNNVALFVG